MRNAVVATDSHSSEMTQVPAVGLFAQVFRFVLIGGLCALVDSGIYWALLQLGLWVHPAKAISFIAGTTTAYVLNRRFTFTQDTGEG